MYYANVNSRENRINNKTKNTKRVTAADHEIQGMVQGHRDGHGFVVPDDGGADLYLPPNEMRAVLHQDHVRACVTGYDRKGRPEGRVVEIVERNPQPIIGRLLNENNIWLVAPEDKRYGQDILIPKDAKAHAKTGQVVVVELTELPALYGQPVGRIIEVLGEVDDPGMEIEIAVRKYGVPHVFSDAALAQAKKLPSKVADKDLTGRVDLRDIALVTIDGEDARDFDDAVYCEPTPIIINRKKTQGWRLLVAIADVSHYVKTGQAIDIDAYERATSVYFPRRVIPMLPEKLSNGLCSLNPDVDRLCMVCDMLITAEGTTHAYQFYPAVMHSHARFTYTQVAAILANTKGIEARQFATRVDDLMHLHGVYVSLSKARQRRGAIDLETTETQIVCDENGRIEKIIPRLRNEAHKLIEEAMLAANVCAADFINKSKHAGLFRVHEGPTAEKVDVLRNFLRTMGIPNRVSDTPSPSELAAIAAAAKDRADAEQIHTMLLRSMQQAIYTPFNGGHFGLAHEAYTHFTSPIRRYPDLLVHRVIKAVLAGKKYQLPELPIPGDAYKKFTQRLKQKGSAHAPQAQSSKTAKANAASLAWQAAGLHCSANERRAEEASRDVQAWLKCQYMLNYLGEELTGTVTSVTHFGLFVTLNEEYVEGLIHITELGGDYFKFDEARQSLIGERTGVRFSLGSRVRVQVIRVDLDGRRIDFRLIRANENGDMVQPKKKESKTKRSSRADTNKKTARASAKTATKSSPKPSSKATRKKTNGSSRSNGRSRSKRKN